MVYAFEPLPETLGYLKNNTAGLPRVCVMPFALSNVAGSTVIERGDDEDAATARLARGAGGAGGIEVMLERGDTLVEGGQVAAPHVIKIDVEGHELEVLFGLQEVLKRPSLKHIFIEVHFAILQSDQRTDVPAEIERILRGSGFKLAWVDQSHLHAFRA
jgi:FkbM family methyltransferase